MGIDIRITLPGDVRVDDVARVMGVLAGLPAEQYSLGSSPSIFVRVKRATVENTTFPDMAQIVLSGQMVDGDIAHFVNWHFEGNGFDRICFPPSTAFWIAVSRGLVDFFGGKVDYQDCDESEVDYQRDYHLSLVSNCPTDGPEWDAFETRILNLTPITAEGLEEARTFAAYKNR